MFSRYYAGRSTSTDFVQRYRESPHKARIDHVARALVALRYRDAVVAQHLREWLRLTIEFDARGISLPSSVHAPVVQTYLAQQLPHGSPSRQRVIRASARLLLETDEQGHFRRRIASAVPRPLVAWFEPALRSYCVFLREHRGLADRTVSKRAWQLGQFAALLEQAGVRTLGHIRALHQPNVLERDADPLGHRFLGALSLTDTGRWAPPAPRGSAYRSFRP